MVLYNGIIMNIIIQEILDMIDVFISYKVADRKTAIEYYKALKEKRLNVWFDQLIPKHD